MSINSWNRGALKNLEQLPATKKEKHPEENPEVVFVLVPAWLQPGSSKVQATLLKQSKKQCKKRNETDPGAKCSSQRFQHQGSSEVPARSHHVPASVHQVPASVAMFQCLSQQGSSEVPARFHQGSSKVPAEFPPTFHQVFSGFPVRFQQFQQVPAECQQCSNKVSAMFQWSSEVPQRFQQVASEVLFHPGSSKVPGLFQFLGREFSRHHSPAPEIETQQIRCWEVSTCFTTPQMFTHCVHNQDLGGEDVYIYEGFVASDWGSWKTIMWFFFGHLFVMCFGIF